MIDKKLREDILSVLVNVKKHFNKDDAQSVLEWSDRIIHSMSVYQDARTITLAIVAYSLGKVLGNRKLRQHAKAWSEFKTRVNQDLSLAIKSVEQNEWKKYASVLRDLIRAVASIDYNFSDYLNFIITGAKVKKGSAMHRHGISLSRVAEVLGISLWELMEYTGKKKLFDDIKDDGVSVSTRYNKAKLLFKER